jgi:alpha-1,2-mannosyltransferase
MHTILLMPFKYVGISKIGLFYLLRCVFALVSSICETMFYQAIFKVYNARIANYYLLISICNAGMFVSATSFLPSTFVQYLVMLSYSCWLVRKNSTLPILMIGSATIIGWPFVAILGLPIVWDYFFIKKEISKFFKFTILYGSIITATMCIFDSYFFGEIIFAPLNIIKYNVFSKLGPNLYGEEPLSFYLFNCLLNFNVIYLLSVVNLPLKLLINCQNVQKKYQYLLSIAMYAWILVFYTRPHKEERFLYPIYPLICLLGAESLELIMQWFKKFKFICKLLSLSIVLIYLLFSISRVYASLSNYSSQLDLFHELNTDAIKYSKSLESREYVYVCMGKEWYRYSSSFFLPESYKRQKWRLKFLESNFKGQLPDEYNEKLNIPKSTRFFNKNFNDANLEVKTRYFGEKYCDFIIDSIDPFDMKGKRYEPKTWKKLKTFKILNTDKSKQFFRAFYIPGYYEKFSKFNDYIIFKKA